MTPDIRAIETGRAAAPGAYYSQGIAAGTMVWTAGAVGIDPATGRIERGLERQIHQAIENVRATLEAAGTDLSHVVKTTCFVTRREDFPKLDPIYSSYFGQPAPARTTIVCDLVQPDFRFEIEAVAVVG